MDIFAQSWLKSSTNALQHMAGKRRKTEFPTYSLSQLMTRHRISEQRVLLNKDMIL